MARRTLNRIIIVIVLLFAIRSNEAQTDWHFSGTNNALNKTATQTPRAWSEDNWLNRGETKYYTASLAVDGNNDSNFVSGSCTHTIPKNKYNSASWTVDLSGNYQVSGIRIFPRRDDQHPASIERLRNFRVIAESGNVYLYNSTTNEKLDEVISVTVDGFRSFTSITVQIPPHTGYPDDGSSILTLCEVQIYAACQPPKAPPNGKYSPDQDGYGVDTMVTLMCDNGYTIAGSNQRTCQENGLWSGSEPVCYENRCNSHLVIRNGIYKYNGASFLFGTRLLGDVITAVCDRGHEHTSGSSQRTCILYEDSSSNMYASWNGTTPTCSLITCPWPIDFPGGNYDNETENTVNISRPYGTVVHAACKNGLFKFTGDKNRTCLENSTWSGVAPTCVALCSAPDITNGHSEVNGSIYEQGQYIYIVCEIGYQLSTGNTQRTCGTDHQWNGGDLVCNANKSKSAEANTEAQGVSPALIGGSAAGAVVLIAVAVLGVVIYRKRCLVANRYAQRMNAEIIPNPNGEYVNIAEAELNTPSRQSKPVPAPKPVYSNAVPQHSDNAYYSFSDTTNMPERAIKLENLSDIVFTGDVAIEQYKTQFESFPLGMTKKHTNAVKKENKPKNKYKNLYAYDDTRVVLNTDEDISESDYINANYIHGFGQENAYVASQGATKENIDDIWRMIWQLDSGKIVMLTNLREECKDKCKQYWPTEGSITYGNVTVTLRKTAEYSDFVIRTLVVCQDGADERVVLQFHFTAWPDRGVPKYASSIVSFRNKVKYTATKGQGPIVVHCSAGIGRTGTFIAIDYLTDQAHVLGYVDAAGCVETLRRQRVNMVQTLDQYIFIHHVLVETLMLATSDIPSSRFHEAYKELLEIDPVKGKRRLHVRFELLKKMSPVADENQYASAKIIRNRKKNRYSNILPVDDYMPHLNPTSTGSEGDYINAVFLPSYKEKRAFIITQTPLESTKEDFWRMVYDHDVHTIVMMDNIAEVKEAEIYWPEEGIGSTFGEISVKHLADEEYDGYKAISLKVERLQKTRTIKQIQCRQWAAGAPLPDEPSCILSLMEVVQSWQQHTGNHPVVVHCMNGADKSGLYCVIAAVIERMKIEQAVAISQVIEEMRNCREQIITSVDQFQFCHEAVFAFMEQFATYSNFSA